jgi:MSHA biogenesis protein MshE
MAGLDISEKRLPQDGRFHFVIRDQHIDIRLSTMPMQHGETAVMRLLNQTAGIPDLNDIGMDPDTLVRFRKSIHSPHGIVLVTGPTGSGKTTTLYAALKDINNHSKKIITVEDPVEYQIPGITQVQVNPTIDLDFPRVLRSLLRQDPDIALIGEMRDKETIDTALRTAMTGHLVLSTLHTNDAISTINRLIDMGVEPFMLASSLRSILAQRLVRKVCESCITDTTLNEAQKALVESTLGEPADSLKFKHGAGCNHCNNSGYMGRTSISEFIEINSTLMESLHKGDLQQFMHEAYLQPGYHSMSTAAFKLAAQGVTSLNEVMRICFGST